MTTSPGAASHSGTGAAEHMHLPSIACHAKAPSYLLCVCRPDFQNRIISLTPSQRKQTRKTMPALAKGRGVTRMIHSPNITWGIIICV
ncbi:hypothetical protein BaRGS_00010208 [Batillaria attramentaria]|uniref:Uncharacterized protein n=1 Tax=Batillaria attramentaria TaxID=370345 RepID=A0ABD0LGN6_9CAEN